MFPAMKRMLLLKLNERSVLAPADYCFGGPSQGGRTVADLRVGDLLYDYEKQLVAVTAIINLGKQPLIAYMGTDEPPFYQPLLVLHGTVVATADGNKRIEELRPGDRILPCQEDDTVWTCNSGDARALFG